jgi:hypothetical protein
MIYQILLGRFWRNSYLDALAPGADTRMIKDSSSMRYFGFSERALLGETYPQTWAPGKIPIAGFADGETREFGKSS